MAADGLPLAHRPAICRVRQGGTNLRAQTDTTSQAPPQAPIQFYGHPAESETVTEARGANGEGTRAGRLADRPLRESLPQAVPKPAV